MPGEPKRDLNVKQLLLLPPPPTTTVSKSLTSKYDIEGSQEVIKETPDMLKELMKEIEDKTIVPLLKSNVDDIEIKFNEIRPTMDLWLKQFSRTILQDQVSEENDLLKIAKLNVEGYKATKHIVESRLDLSSDIRQKIVQIIDNLNDYDDMLLDIAIKRPEQFKLALEKIDLDDLQKNLLDTYMAFFSILYIIKKKEYDKEKLSKLANLAKEYSEEMESYVDTIDILSNPKTIESIRKSENYYNLSND
jgi:hypothetical protein